MGGSRSRSRVAAAAAATAFAAALLVLLTGAFAVNKNGMGSALEVDKDAPDTGGKIPNNDADDVVAAEATSNPPNGEGNPPTPSIVPDSGGDRGDWGGESRPNTASTTEAASNGSAAKRGESF